MMGNRRLSCLLKPLLRRGWGGLGVLGRPGSPAPRHSLPAQTAFVWQAGAQAFFDNEEYARSAVQSPQTMAGVHLAPQVGVSWQGRHRVFAGVDALKEFGTDRVIDRADLMAYYEFESPAFHFRMGAFPRRDVLGRYPRMFFQDSVAYFRPVMTGLFWEYHRPRGYFNVWLDWTGRQDEGRRETFFMGWSGRYQRGVFYAQHFGYMYHFARSKHPAVPEHLHDNGLLLVSAGWTWPAWPASTSWRPTRAGAPGWSATATTARGHGTCRRASSPNWRWSGAASASTTPITGAGRSNASTRNTATPSTGATPSTARGNTTAPTSTCNSSARPW